MPVFACTMGDDRRFRAPPCGGAPGYRRNHHMSTPCFTDAAWQRNLPLFNATLALPFNRELAAGTLSRERFQHYGDKR